MNTQQDLLTIGGHTFTSRFILGSGKYSLELIQAAIEKAGAQIVTLALRRANEGGLANILDYIPRNRHPAAQHLRRAQCRRSGPHCPSRAGTGLRRLYQNRSDPRLQIPAAGQLRDHQGDGGPGKRGICRHALHVSRPERRAGIWPTRARPASCRLARRSARTRAFAPRSSSRS